jgi:hypothetical protein
MGPYGHLETGADYLAGDAVKRKERVLSNRIRD